ncbi:MAG: hypothetical protein CL920_29690 [Deltaproteobacteria bacterium]|nr:hypothetical protein [Deltaproteobacteria bacterium]MBU52886.1 hypothetical protein [Deltaproteobacteria bacterium]|tara:strand:+ start:29511 stop:30800 length:1290 start_codon:yes stop_codon:yes gene_type:complete
MSQTLWWRLRWVLLGIALTMGIALLISMVLGYNSTQRISKKLGRAEGYALLNDIRRDLQASRKRIDTPTLQSILKKRSKEGLHFIGAYRLRGRNIAKAGRAKGYTTFPVRRKDLLADTQYLPHGRIRMYMLGLKRRPHPFRHFRRHRHIRPWRFPRKRRRPPLLIVEFTPQSTTFVQEESGRTLLIGGGVFILLLVMMVGFAILLRHLSRLEAQRQQQQQLAALGEMSAVLAHEIRNPLTSLKGHAQLLEEMLEGDKLHTKAERVVQEAVRLETLSGQLLDFVKAEQLQREPVQLVTLVRELIATFETEQIRLHTDTAPETWPVDKMKFRQILANILENALQASPESGNVDLTLSQRGSSLSILITDQGEGIPADKLEHIFTPFVTSRLHGTGLGLAITRRLVELHHGTITASNRKEGGAQFAITLPKT